MPDAESQKNYRIQVGAFEDTINARKVYETLERTGFSPALERYEEFYRVVLPGIRAADIPQAAQRLGALGFAEVFVRPEN
jgi:cell division protein FtsN